MELIDFTIIGEQVAPISVGHRLSTTGNVDDGQTSMADEQGLGAELPVIIGTSICKLAECLVPASLS